MTARKQFVEKLRAILYVSTGGIGIFSAYNIYNGKESYYNNFLLPLLHRTDPETAHQLAVVASKYELLPKSRYIDPDNLATNVWHLNFQNPVGVAAGFDKQGEAIVGLSNIGFGFVEIGSVTPEPQPGNEKPRVFRLPENFAIINRYGFNSDGHEAVFERIEDLRFNKNYSGIIGVNLGKNKNSLDPVQDYVKGIERFGTVADYLVINISSPNTPGLRDWQGKDQLKVLLSKLVQAKNKLELSSKPLLLVKLAPDMTKLEMSEVASVINDPKCKIDGLVISNTTIERDSSLVGEHTNEIGGLSGTPLNKMSTEMISEMYKLTKGKIPIIGVGGIFTGKDAYDKIKAGASLVQFYTAFIYHGPPRVTRIKDELNKLLMKDGYKSLNEAVGKDVQL